MNLVPLLRRNKVYKEIKRCRGARINLKDVVNLVGPGKSVGFEIPLPVAHVGNVLGLFKAFLKPMPAVFPVDIPVSPPPRFFLGKAVLQQRPIHKECGNYNNKQAVEYSGDYERSS